MAAGSAEVSQPLHGVLDSRCSPFYFYRQTGLYKQATPAQAEGCYPLLLPTRVIQIPDSLPIHSEQEATRTPLRKGGMFELL